LGDWIALGEGHQRWERESGNWGPKKLAVTPKAQTGLTEQGIRPGNLWSIVKKELLNPKSKGRKQVTAEETEEGPKGKGVLVGVRPYTRSNK